MRTTLPIVASLLGALLLLGCGEERLPVGAADCWGAETERCEGAPAAVKTALGGSDLVGPLAEVRCGELLDCDTLGGGVAAAVAPPSVRGPATREPVAQPSTGTPEPTPGVEPPIPDPTPEEADSTPAPAPDPTPAAPAEPVATASCDVMALEDATSLSAADVACLQGVATGAMGASDPERQVAAITLYNRRAAGWGPAVEAALSRPALANAPLLNFAAIKPAYDARRYGDVLARSRTVWRNLGKGYQLGGADKTFLVEFACRSAGQLALGGKPPTDGLDWCERWLERAESAGQDTAAAEALIEQLE